ncbi:DUF4491 family protein [Lacrimispora sp. JR3]
MNYEGIIIGMGTFLLIGLLHPVVIKAEYYFGTKIWPAFLAAGIVCIVLSLFSSGRVLSPLLAVLGFSLLWSIKELFEQKQRVEKGWFPRNPNKKIFE